MNSRRTKKIYYIIFLLLLSGAIVSLIVYALQQNINLFYTPTQIMAKEAPLLTRIRVGGMVEKQSIIRKEGTEIEFYVTDFKNRIKINYKGILPDLFREGQGVVALGQLHSNTELRAEQILAKHDENYMPKEITENLK